MEMITNIVNIVKKSPERAQNTHDGTRALERSRQANSFLQRQLIEAQKKVETAMLEKELSEEKLMTVNKELSDAQSMIASLKCQVEKLTASLNAVSKKNKKIKETKDSGEEDSSVTATI